MLYLEATFLSKTILSNSRPFWDSDILYFLVCISTKNHARTKALFLTLKFLQQIDKISFFPKFPLCFIKLI